MAARIAAALLLLAATALAEVPGVAEANEAFPDADAVILAWDQSFTVRADGSRVRRERRLVLLRNSRPIGRHADPRIDWREGRDEVVIHAARTHLPTGAVLDVPAYGIVTASPGDTASWPAFADFRQTVVTFVGIEPGAVLEFDYEVREGPMPFSLDLPVAARDPILCRTVTVASEKPITVGAPGRAPLRKDDGRTLVWEFSRVPGETPEPLSETPPDRRLRLAADAAGFAASFLTPVCSASRGDETVRAFARQAAGDAPDPRSRVERLVAALRGAVTTVAAPRAVSDRRCRPAEEVLASGYGNPLEAAALLRAMLAALSLMDAPRLAVDPRVADSGVLTDADVLGVVVRQAAEGREESVHPALGLLRDPGALAAVLLDADGRPAGRLRARGEDGSDFLADGTLALDAEGRLSGELRLVLSGRHFDPAALADDKARAAFLEGAAGKVVPGLKVSAVALEELSDARLAARLAVASAAPLPKADGRFVLELPEDPATLAVAPLPLARSERREDLVLPGPCREQVRLAIRPPPGAPAPALPASHNVNGEGFGIEQHAEFEDGAVRFHRWIALGRTLQAASWRDLPQGLNGLRAPAGRTFLFGR